MNFQNFHSNLSTSASTIMNPTENKEEEFNYLDDLPDEEEEERVSELSFNQISQIQIKEAKPKEENGFRKIDKKKRFKVIKHLKRRLDKELKRLFLKKKTFKVKKSFVKMGEKEFYEKYILGGLSVKETFSGFSKENRRIFLKLAKRVKFFELEHLFSTKIGSFF